jgi:hypothetical protein
MSCPASAFDFFVVGVGFVAVGLHGEVASSLDSMRWRVVVGMAEVGGGMVSDETQKRRIETNHDKSRGSFSSRTCLPATSSLSLVHRFASFPSSEGPHPCEEGRGTYRWWSVVVGKVVGEVR